jgi:hypothetical protein
MSFMFDKVKGAVHDVQSTLKGKPNYHAHTTHGSECSDGDSRMSMPLLHLEIRR